MENCHYSNRMNNNLMKRCHNPKSQKNQKKLLNKNSWQKLKNLRKKSRKINEILF